MGSVFKISEDNCVFHWVIAYNQEHAIDIFHKNNIDSHGYESEAESVTVDKLPLDTPLTIDCSGIKIKLSVEEWSAIYDYTPRYLACSEY